MNLQILYSLTFKDIENDILDINVWSPVPYIFLEKFASQFPRFPRNKKRSDSEQNS